MEITDLDTAGEEGLIDVTLDPNFEQNDYIYIYYTPQSSGKNRIARFTHQEDTGGLSSSADPSSEFVVWEDNSQRKSDFHHGGGLDFGPDGKLYLTMGEEVDGPQAQDLTEAGGSVIRVNKDGTIPQDNPYVDGAGGNVDAIWAHGLRNPFRAEWDLQADNPRYYIAEVGGNNQDTAQEDLHIGEKGANYGWPDCEGECDDPAYTDALYTYPHEGSGASITGGVVYHDDQFPSEYDGAYFFADYVRGWMKYLTFDSNGDVSSVNMFDDDVGAVVEIDEGPDGSLYYLEIGSGTLTKVSYDQTADAEPTLDAPANVFVDEDENKQISITASDADDDALTLSASNLPSFASFTDNGDGTATLSLSPSSGDAGVYQTAVTVSDGDDDTSETVSISVLEPGAEQILYRLNAGQSSVQAIDDGPDWESDSQYMTTAGDVSDWSGASYSVGSAVPATTPDAIFESERYPSGGSTIDYDLPVTSGETYEVRLYFIEQYDQAQNVGDRIFDVTLEEQTVLNDYDVVNEVGYKNATMESFEVTADDGALDLSLTQDGGSANPLIYGIEVVQPDDNQDPSASFTASATDVETGQAIDFDAGGSSDPDGSIASYEWDFGDGDTAMGATPSHTYDNAGTYTVEVTVTDNDGATDTATTTITVTEPTTTSVVYRVNAGGPELQASEGPNWESDNASSPSQHIVADGNFGNTVWPTFEPGQTFSVGSAVPASTPDAVFDYERWASDDELEYSFPVTSGETYEVRVYFIERYADANGSADRVMDVSAEGQTFLDDYDASNEVGWKNGTMESVEVTADDGTLDLTIADVSDDNNPNVFAIEILEPGDQPNQAPTATIDTPQNGSIFQAGDTISYSGSATDPEDGTLSDSQLEWTVQFLHNEHFHPYQSGVVGSSGSFTVPTSGHDFQDDTRYKIILEATDSAGATDSTHVVVEPDKVNLTFETQPSGLEFKLDGIPYTSSHVHDTLIGFQHTITAPQTQCVDGTQYEFDSWSDNGAAEHTITVPGSDETYTAVYTETGQCGQSVIEAVASQNAPTDQIDTPEILQAINWWATEATVPGTDGKTITTQEILQLINFWATDATVGNQNQPPTADFHVHDPVAGQPATYHSESTDSDGQITNYEWDFDNDGTFEESTTNVQVQHTFPSAGDYDVTLKVTDDDGATDTVTKTVTVSQATQQALYRVNAGGPELQASEGPDWESDNASSPSQHIVADGNLDNTVWPTFEPGQTFSVGSAVPDSTPDAIFDYERYATDDELEYAFPVTSGETYEVRVYFIERFDGANGSADRVMDVSAEGQTFLDDYDTSNEVGWKNGTMESFEVTADDGTLDLTIADVSDDNSPNVFGIEVLGTADGDSNQAPSASITASATDAETGQSIDFDASGSTDSDGSIASYEWDFGDGDTATGATPSHTYDNPGTYTVEVTVTDNDGATDTATTTITVTEPTTASVVYRVNAGGPEVPAIDGGPDWAVDDNTDQSPYLLGDGDLTEHDQQFNVTASVPASTPEDIFVTERYVGSQMNWEFPVTSGDTYEVRLYYIEQWEPNSNVGDRVFDVSIEGTTVQDDYDVMADVGFDNATMKSFTVTAQDGTLDIDFAQDGGGAYPLIYGIEILKPGAGGGNQAPIASFTASPTNANTGETVSFDASGSTDLDGQIQSYAWDFDDGNTATGEQVSHAFASAGTYTVELTVTDNDGDSATATEQVSVSEPAGGQFVTEQMASGLDGPVAMEVLPDDRMLILERGGDVLIAEEQGSSLATSEYLSLPSVSTNGEQGLLGVTIDPNFESNGYVYLYYTNETTDRNQISRFVHQENGGGLQSTADLASEEKIWNSTIQGDATFHHGGGLDFGPDGKLYLTTGEQFTSTRAQDLSSTGGKIIRINNDGSIPSDNPYVNDGDPNTRGDIWASGLRNPFKAEWDHPTNRFFVAEVGLTTAEDIHLGEKGANYGWPNCEGECSDPAYSDPIYTYPYEGGAAVTGGDFYRGSQFPSEYEGVYFYGDYVRGWIKYLTFDSSGNVTGSQNFIDDADNVVEIDQGPGGSLYYIDVTGSIHRVSFEPAEEGSASISLNEGNSNIDTSTWKTGAVEIQNTGDKQIESVTFDLSTAAIPDIVFGPLTDSGTPGNAVKDASGVGGFQTSYSQPHDGNPDDGYDQLTFTYDDFQPGETFTVSLDTDALSIKGATPFQQGLEISGLETTGTSIIIEYADGTTQTTTPFSDGSAAGAVATAESDVPAPPSLGVQGVTLDSSVLDARHSGATVSSAQQTVEISGEPGSTVRVLRFEGELNLDGVSGYDLEPYEANRILNFDEQTVTLDSNGEATVDVTLTNSSATGGLNYLVAVAEDAQGDTGLTSDPIVLKYDQNAAQPSGGEATVAITTTEAAFPDGMITLQDATTYFEDSVLITNTGDQEIESLTIDKDTALIENMVFDPTGCAGDGGCNPGNTNLRIVNDGGAGMSSHQFLDPVNGVDGTDGYRALHFEFDDFEPGETFSYASDGDPNTIKGGGGQQSVLAGPESGIDLTGTTVTATFADGTTASSGTFNEDSLAGSTGVARANAPDAPSIDAQDVTLQATTLSDRHTAATVADADQTIEISGPPGETVRLMHAEATLLLEDVPTYDGTPGYDIEAYEANNVENYTITDVQLDENGEATVDTTLTNLTGELTSPADESGFNYFVATVQGDDGHAGTASNVVILKLDEGSQAPSIQSVDDQFLTEGDSTTVTVEATDPNGDPLTLSASDLPDFASFTDNGDGTGTLTLSPETGDAGNYDVTLSASDGEHTTTQQVTVGVSEPGADQVVHRLHAGSGTISAIDSGPDWESDSQYMTTAGDTSDWSGTTYTVGPSVPASTPDAVFETERYPTGGSTIDYDLPVTQGETYEVRLYFIEQYSDTQNPGDRVFDVTIDDQTVLNDYDVVADVGFKNATMKSFEVTADDGTLDLSFSQASGASPFMYGVEVVKPDSGNQAPSASFSASATDVETGQTVDFDASASSDSDGSIQSYEWDFDGDGTVDSTGQNVSHAFQSAGTYDVELTVTDDDGDTDTATTTVTVTEPTTSSVLHRVNAGGPEIAATDGGPDWESDNTTQPSQHLVDDGSIGTTNWLTFEDGPLNYNVGSAVPASTPDAVFEYERYASDSELEWQFPVTAGETYEVRLYFIEQYEPANGSSDRVIDVTAEGQTVLSGYDTSSEVGFKNATMESFAVTPSDGTLDLTIVQASGSNSPNVFAIEVIGPGDEPNQAPSASFTASATDVETGQTVDFDASGSSDPDSSIQSYEWDFDGDGATDATGAQVSHAFQSAGTYQVNLTVTDDAGATASAQQPISVSEPTSSNVVYRVNTGGSEISVPDEPDWENDLSYLLTSEGVTNHDTQFNVTDSVPTGTPEQIFVTERWPASGSTLDYEFSVTSGETYEVRLYFIEQWSPNDEEGTRIFDVTAEGQTVLNDYDIMVDVGFDNATMKSFEVTADDGTLDISLTQDGGSANPFVYGIEIVEKGS